MKKLSQKRSVSAAMETMENRLFLSATVVQQIPTQSLTLGQSAAPITLSDFLTDPAITGGTVIKMATPLGNMFLQLTDSQTPMTVANFVHYIDDGEYVPTMIQRSIPGFVLQGGGTMPDGANNNPDTTLQSEAGISNTTGTIAMALSDGPDSATNQWFINLANNNSASADGDLDNTSDGGPFTVFGNVIDGTMSVANAIANLQVIDASGENGQWSNLPVVNYSGSASPSSVSTSNIVSDNISTVSAQRAAPKYSVVSANPNLVTAGVSDGVLTLTPVAGTASGSTTVTATVTDVAGETATSTFTVNVSGATPANLTFIQGPKNVKAGKTITPVITVSVTDGSGDPVNNTKVKLEIAGGPSGAALGGTLKAVSQNGVADFSNVSLTTAGNYTLEAFIGSVTSAPSATFKVRPAAATQLAFAQPPTQADVGADITPDIVVNVEDQFGNIVTTNDSNVTLVIKPGTGPDGAVLGGTLTILAQDGVATFSDVSLDETGSYKLKAKDGTLIAAKSPLFNIVAAS